ncbi:hypothetical protein Q5O14_15175 [Eubacteriaceae bacterium ES2]|nr:hypothetical protein Q5O14_15175 [Eubacteriaceae bacterium ES2]
MFKKIYFGKIINITLGIALCMTLGSFALWYNQQLNFSNFIFSFLTSFFVSYTVGDLIPAKKWGDSLAAKLNLKKESIPAYLISIIIVTICMVTIISFMSTLIQLGFSEILIPAWLSLFPLLLLIGYIAMLIFFHLLYD